MSADIDKERAAFEAAGAKLFGWGERDYERQYEMGVARDYSFLEQRHAFALWQAARATPSPAPTDQKPLGYFSRNSGSTYGEVDPKYAGDADVIALYDRPSPAPIPEGQAGPQELTPQQEDADDIALMVASAVLDHIDSMYPDMWKMVAKTARISIRNTIRNQSVRYLKFILANPRDAAPTHPSATARNEKD